jgi:DNA-binding CsgD family transcriptional regulator
MRRRTTSAIVPVGDESSPLVDEIYTAALDPGYWPRVLACLADTFGCSPAHLAEDNFAMTEGRMLSFGADPNYERLYAEHYVNCNVLWQRMLKGPLDGVMTSRTVISRDEFRRSEFYNDFLSPQGAEELLISVVLKQADRVDTVILARPERLGAWQPEHMQALAALTPHFRRALQVNRSLGELRIVHDLVGAALHRLQHAVVLVGAQGRVLFANRAAEAMLGDAAGLSMREGRVAAGQLSNDAALVRLIAHAAQNRTGGSLVITRDGRPSLTVIAVPPSAEACGMFCDPPGAILFVKDMERPATQSLARFARHFELTPAEAAVVDEVARGDGITALAKRLGISRTTARTHVQHVFQKTGTHRQAELIRLMDEWKEAVPACGAGPAKGS